MGSKDGLLVIEVDGKQLKLEGDSFYCSSFEFSKSPMNGFVIKSITLISTHATIKKADTPPKKIIISTISIFPY